MFERQNMIGTRDRARPGHRRAFDGGPRETDRGCEMAVVA